MIFFNNLGLFLSNLRMIERGCGLHRLKDKDDVEESTLSVFLSSSRTRRSSPVLGRDRSSGSGLFWDKGSKTKNLDPRSRVVNEAHSDLRIRKRNHKPGHLGLDPEVRIQDLGSQQGQEEYLVGIVDRHLSQFWLSFLTSSSNKEMICHVCLHLQRNILRYFGWKLSPYFGGYVLDNSC